MFEVHHNESLTTEHRDQAPVTAVGMFYCTVLRRASQWFLCVFVCMRVRVRTSVRVRRVRLRVRVYIDLHGGTMCCLRCNQPCY